jgi:hypothetical protein
VSIYELEIGWAETTDQLHALRWELLACNDVVGVFRTTREDLLAVLFSGSRPRFDTWARSLVAAAAR